MHSKPSKLSGKLTRVIGSAKEKIGKATGNRVLQAKGAQQKAKGEVETQRAKAKYYREAKKRSVTGTIKRGVGKVLGNDKMQAEGRADQAYATES